MRAFITGGNGFLGAHLIEKLLSEGLEVTAFIRKSSRLTELKSPERIQFVYGDITDKVSIVEALRVSKPDVVFHLAGYIGYKKAERPLMDAINVHGTRNLIEAMVETKVPKLVHMSSVVAVGAGYRPTEILDESSKFNLSPLNLGYFETKRQAEELVVKATQQGEIKSVILNPSTIYGPADAKKGSRKTQLKVAQGKFKFYTSGGVSVVSVEDVIEGIYRGFKVGRNGERYILSGENILIKELFEKIAGFAGVPAPSIYLPDVALHMIGRAGDLITRLGKPVSLSQENAWTATLFHWFKNDKARKELGIDFKPADYSIKQSVDWMRENKLI
ncbi:MAG: NAD-dependent epimerase/dehydratase family protein [Bdellovibrionaceae bacterium]|nr:NAD-dependent epimerase/dehydratase family protein [Pseudobdellovibrionaceae bacterium]